MNNKSLFERISSIKNKGPSKWLSRGLFEGQAEQNAANDAIAMGGSVTPKQPIVPTEKPQMTVTSGAEGGASSNPQETPLDQARDKPSDISISNIKGNARQIQRNLIPDFTKMSQLYGDAEQLENKRLEPARAQIAEMKKRIESETDGKKKANLAAQQGLFGLQVLLGETFSEKDRSGISRTLSENDAKQIHEHADQLTEAFGDGSRETIEKFVKSRKLYDTPNEVARAFLKSAPPELVETLKSSSGVYSKGQQKYFDPKNPDSPVTKAAQRLHYKGPEGARGGASTQQRMEALMKTLLDQGMVDPYTGLPLYFDYMELDHVTDKMNPEDGPDVNPDGLPRLDSEEYRDHPDNWLWSSTSTNNVKNNYGFDFLVKRAKQMINDGETFPDRFFEEAAREKIGTHRDQLHGMMLKDGVLGENVTEGMLEHLFKSEQSLVDIVNGGDESDVVNKAYRKLMQALGATTDQTQKRREELMQPDEVTPSNQLMTPETLFRPFLNKLVGQSPEAQRELIQKWSQSSEDARNTMADLSVGDPELWGQDDNFAVASGAGAFNRNGTWNNYLYKNLSDNGLIDLDEIKKHTTKRQFNAIKKILKNVGVE